MKTKSYFTLLIKDDTEWCIHFGDYDREVVEDEKDDLQEGYGKACKMKIIRTGDTQVEIDDAVKQLNNKQGKA